MYLMPIYLVSLITYLTRHHDELSKVVADGNILRLVEKFLKAGVMKVARYRRLGLAHLKDVWSLRS